jgi:hypothetical protein
MHALQLGIGDCVVDHHDGSRGRPERGDGVQGHPVVGAIGRWCDDNIAGGADALLKSSVVLD